MATKWAEKKTAWLFRAMEGGGTWLDGELEWNAEESIQSRSYDTPAQVAFSNAVALILTGHRPEAERFLNQASSIVQAFFTHHQDQGTWMSSLIRRSMLIHRFNCEWLLHGNRNPGHLAQAVEALVEAERRAIVKGSELGEDGYEEIALLHVLQGNGGAALEALPRAVERPVAMDLAGMTRGKPTRIKTLALAAYYLENPAVLPAEQVRQRIEKGVAAFMNEQFAEIAPDTSSLLLWLDLPNVLFGEQGDPWTMLEAINRMVKE